MKKNFELFENIELCEESIELGEKHRIREKNIEYFGHFSA